MSELREKCAKVLCAMDGQTPNCLEAIWCIPEADAKLIDGDINNFPARYVWRGYTDRADAVMAVVIEEAAKVADRFGETNPNLEKSHNPTTARAIASIMSETGTRIASAIRALNTKVQG